MSADLLRRLLEGRLADPECGEPLSVPTKSIAIENSLRGREAALLSPLELGRRLAVVGDPTTWEVLGKRVAAGLAALWMVDPLILPDRPHADIETVEQVRARTAGADGLVSVGSGTINDLVKYAAHLDGKPYVSFATAPSMNGYTSLNAAITEHGVKKSLAASAPRGVFFDVEVLCRAPARMIRAGFGDSICRSTAQADWLLAHLLHDQAYREAPFFLLAEDEAELVADPAKLLAGDKAAMTRLARLLVMSGFGMTIAGGSYPASQGEHLISHFIEMIGDPAWTASFHGEQIAVATLTMARIQGKMLAMAEPRVSPNRVTESAMISFYGPETGPAIWRIFAEKALDAAGAATVNARLAARWPEIRRQIQTIHQPAAILEAALKRIGAPTRPSDINVPDDFYRDAVLHAREIRNRYTFLDLAMETGHLTSDLIA